MVQILALHANFLTLHGFWSKSQCICTLCSFRFTQFSSWKNGKCLIWDATVADTLCTSYVSQCSKNPGAAADARETIKNSHYEELSNNYCFVPVGIETFGSWGFEGHKLVKEIIHPPPCHPFYYIGLCTSVTFWPPPSPF